MSLGEWGKGIIYIGMHQVLVQSTEFSFNRIQSAQFAGPEVVAMESLEFCISQPQHVVGGRAQMTKRTLLTRPSFDDERRLATVKLDG